MTATVEYTEEVLTGLACASRTFDAWCEQGEALAVGQSTARQFEIGDWLLDGEERWGIESAYHEAYVVFPNVSHNSLKAFASVARCVRADIRVHALSWNHHRLIARFAGDPDVQRSLLARAAANDWSLSTFRKHIDHMHPVWRSPTLKGLKPLKPLGPDSEDRYRQLCAFVISLYGKLPLPQRAEEMRQHAKRMIEECNRVIAAMKPKRRGGGERLLQAGASQGELAEKEGSVNIDDILRRPTHDEIRRVCQAEDRKQFVVCPGCGGRLLLFGKDEYACAGSDSHEPCSADHLVASLFEKVWADRESRGEQGSAKVPPALVTATGEKIQ